MVIGITASSLFTILNTWVRTLERHSSIYAFEQAVLKLEQSTEYDFDELIELCMEEVPNFKSGEQVKCLEQLLEVFALRTNIRIRFCNDINKK